MMAKYSVNDYKTSNEAGTGFLNNVYYNKLD